MPGFKRWIFIGMIIASVCPLRAQDADTLLTMPDSSFLSYRDSLNIFRLIDSLLMLEELEPRSQLAVRLGYNSNVLAAGRTLGIEQFGLSPSLSFYHKRGFFADVSGYWSRDFEPAYYLTVLSGGYMHTFSNCFSVTGNYDRYIYNTDIPDQYIDFKNTVGITPYFDYKFLSLRADYSFFFGNQTAHRLMPALGLNFVKRNFLKIQKISFMPTACLLLGNETSTTINTTTFEIEEEELFGIMNYAFSFPVYIRHKNLSVYVGYTYSIPQKLANEITLPPKTGYITAGITCYFDLTRNKLSL